MIWGQVVESDQLYSSRTRKWYEVSSTSTGNGQARIHLKGVPKPLVKPAAEEVPAEMVKRGGTGKVVDLFIVAFSGPTRMMESESES